MEREINTPVRPTPALENIYWFLLELALWNQVSLKILFSWKISFFGENVTRKMAEQSTHMYKTIWTNWNFWNSDWKQFFCIQNYLERIDWSATNGTFVTQDEIESKYWTTPTKDPKLCHWVDNTLNQLVTYICKKN